MFMIDITRLRIQAGPAEAKQVGYLHRGSIELNFYTCNLRVQLLFSGSKTMATLVNYTGKSFIKLTPGLLRTNPGSGQGRERTSDRIPTRQRVNKVLRTVKDSAAFTTIFPL